MARTTATPNLRDRVLDRVLGPSTGARDLEEPIDIDHLSGDEKKIVGRIARQLAKDRGEGIATINGRELSKVLEVLSDSATASSVRYNPRGSSVLIAVTAAQIRKAVKASVADPMQMPADMVSFMKSKMWPQMHLQWHAVRRASVYADLIQKMHWKPAQYQEGDVHNGWEFGLMHRAMVQILRAKFPKHAALVEGWGQVPTDVKSTTDPHPPGTPDIDPRAVTAIGLLQSLEKNWSNFQNMDDDAFLRFIETSIIGNGATAWDPSLGMAGLHNYLHNWFQNPKSPIDMGDPTKNIFNMEFWRLHGWIDALWTRFRAKKGESDEDPTYVQALAAAKKDMSMKMMGSQKAMVALPANESFSNFFAQP
jgi:hypothetical protein